MAQCEPPTVWDGATGKNILWKVLLPNRGLGQPVVMKDRVFVLSEPGWEHDWPLLQCFEAATEPEHGVSVGPEPPGDLDIGIQFREWRGGVAGQGHHRSGRRDERSVGNHKKGDAEMKTAIALMIVCAFGAATLHAADDAAKPWPAPVPGWKAVEPGEHPRLIFRKADVPGLRKRAQTPEGRVIMARLKQILEGPITREWCHPWPDTADMIAKQKDGPFTVWHAAGWAFLYQISGDKQHAEKARVFAERAFAREANPDGRYTWPGNGQLRAGPALSALGLAYDMAYDGWDAATRKKIAQGIMANGYLAGIANSPRHGPGCNHWGAHTGGAGIAALALRGDPEVDNAKIEGILAKLVTNAKREIVEGFGRRGYYYEGHHCGRLSANTGLIPFIQAYRVAVGQDLVANCPNAQWLLTRWVYEFVDHPGEAGTLPPRDTPFLYTYNSRGMYRREFRRSQSSEGGDFAQGFGICPEAHRPAVLWMYHHIVEPGAKTYDVTGVYPHLAAYALANWPIGVEEKNPEYLGRVLYDEGPGYFIFRNGWKDTGNVVVTVLLGNTPAGGRGMAAAGQVELCGLGVKKRLPGIFAHCRPTLIRYDAKNGLGVISATPRASAKTMSIAKNVKVPTEGVTSVAVDCSGASGAEALVVMTGPLSKYYTGYWLGISETELDGQDQVPESRVTGARCTTQTVEAGGRTFQVSLLHKGPPPAVKVEGAGLIIGGQTVTFDGENLNLKTLRPTFEMKSVGPEGGSTAP